MINQDTRFVAVGQSKYVESIMLYPGGYFHLQTEISLNQVYYGRYTIGDGEVILSIGDKEYWHFTYLDNELTLVDADGVELFNTGERFAFEELDLKQTSTDRHPSLEDLLRMPFD